MRSTDESNLHRRLSPAADALLGFLQPAGALDISARVRELPPLAWDAIVTIALRHGVAPLLHRTLQSGDALAQLPERARTILEGERRTTALVNLRNLGQFQRVARALDQRDIPVMPLKGLHLAELVYRDISLRPMSDMDVLVPRSKAKQAVAVLRDQGYGLETDLSGVADAMLDTKYDVELRNRQMDILLELHWSLFGPAWRYTVLTEDIWRSGVSARVGDTAALVMSPEFSLLHVCAHLACHHVFVISLRALYDIAEVVRIHPRLDWSVVADQSRRFGWQRGVGAALRLAIDHLGAAVPAAALAALGADALDPDLLKEAMEQLVASRDVPEEFGHAANLAAFAAKRRLPEKLATIRARAFISRAELALTYRVPENSARLPLYYLVRVGDLLRRYAGSAWALKIADPQLAAAVGRHARLARWINDV